MPKKTIFLLSAIAFFCVLLMSRCFLLNRFIYTDKELEKHYENKNIKPSYHDTKFLGSSLHYAKICKNDSLPLLIFIHGAPGAWYGYMNLMDDTILQNHYTMISIDRIGYGKSNYGHAELSTQMQALSILQIIEAENKTHKKVRLLGRSYGSPIAAWLAIRYPQLIECLYMVSPVIDPNAEKFYWFSSIGKWAPVQWLLPDFLNVATKEKYAHVSEMKKMTGQWKNLFVPAYVVLGENDQIADTANYTFAKQKLKSGPTYFYKLKNTGHLVTYEQPEFIRQLLLMKE